MDFVGGSWISWISLFRQTGSGFRYLGSGFCGNKWISWILLFRQTEFIRHDIQYIKYNTGHTIHKNVKEKVSKNI